MPHHLGNLRTGATTAIITGDPDRVPLLGAALGPETASWSRRGYVGVEVAVETLDAPVLVCSTGIGGPTTAIIIEELAELGLRTVVRVGTCGSMQARVRAGDLVVSSGAVRDDGTSGHYLPPEFPAIPDFALLAAITEAVRAASHRHHVGVTHCKDAYYAEFPDRMPMSVHWRERWAILRAAGVLATEMEAAALYVVGAIRGLRTAAILMAVDESLDDRAGVVALQLAARAAVAGAVAIEHDTGTAVVFS